jgi:hypothetical protein
MVAESVLTVTTSTEAGHRIDDHMTVCDVAGGSTFANDGTVMLLVINSAGAKSGILGVTYQAACAYGVSHSRSYTCTAAQNHLIGPFSTAHFNDTNGLVHITWSDGDASELVMAFKKGATMG